MNARKASRYSSRFAPNVCRNTSRARSAKADIATSRILHPVKETYSTNPARSWSARSPKADIAEGHTEPVILISRICDLKIRISSCLAGQISGIGPPSPCRHEGRFAVVTKRGAGCDGTLPRQVLAPDETCAAYGEVVWSWRRDPGVHIRWPVPAGATVTTKAAHRGEHEVSRQTIARGKPGCLGCTCQTRVHSTLCSAHGVTGAASARLSLRPLSERGPSRCRNPDENESRE
jgi:hypothetical protein